MKTKHPGNEEIGAMLRSATEAFPPPDGTKEAIRTAIIRQLPRHRVAKDVPQRPWAMLCRIGVGLAAACLVLAVGWWLLVQHDPMTSAYAEISRALDKELPGRLRGSDIDERLLEQLQRFYEAYRLEPSRNLKLVPQPFMPERATYIAWKGAESMVRLPKKPFPNTPTWINFHWIDHRVLRYSWKNYGSYWPFKVRCAHVFDISQARMSGDTDLLDRPIPADLIYRQEAPTEVKAQELEQALREKLGWQIELRLRTVERPVVVLSGQYQYKPLRGYDGMFGGMDIIEIYGSKPREYRKSGPGGGRGDFEKFVSWVGDFIGKPVVSGAITGAPRRLAWVIGPRASRKEVWPLPEEETQLVLQHLAEQTGLTFRVEERQVRMLFVESSRPKT